MSLHPSLPEVTVNLFLDFPSFSRSVDLKTFLEMSVILTIQDSGSPSSSGPFRFPVVTPVVSSPSLLLPFCFGFCSSSCRPPAPYLPEVRHPVDPKLRLPSLRYSPKLVSSLYYVERKTFRVMWTTQVLSDIPSRSRLRP